jgi:hypothetical protein
VASTMVAAIEQTSDHVAQLEQTSGRVAQLNCALTPHDSGEARARYGGPLSRVKGRGQVNLGRVSEQDLMQPGRRIDSARDKHWHSDKGRNAHR